VLFVILVVHACAFKLRIGPVPFLVLSVLFYASVAVIPLGWAVGAAVRAYMMYFALGNVLGATGALTRMRSLGTPALAVIAIAGHALIWGGSYFNWDETYVGRPIGAVLGVSGTIAASMLLERVSWSRLIDLWGRRSMEIYVVHVIALAAVRLFLLNVLGWHNLPAHFLLGMIAGLHIPIAVWWGAERIGFPYLFSLQPRRSSLQEKGA
jgi:fucose 4-O-acetylase-like acetyltransferase